MITSLGAGLVGERFKNVIEMSFDTLAENQSKKGQISNAVIYNGKKKVDYKSIDSSLWFIIGYHIFLNRFNNRNLFSKYKKNIDAAVKWLSYQDMGEDHLLEQQPTSDWQDAFPHRYGHTINTQALWYKTLKLIGNNAEADIVKEVCNNNKDDGLWNGNYYIPWRWKNHNEFHERGEWFDSLGNLLAIVFELADKSQAEKILSYIEEEKINLPYPIKAIYPPITKNSKDWQGYFEDCDARTPYHYLNGGIWTFIGGFYILALIKQNKIREAEHNLKKLAEANLKSNFSEWLHGRTGKPGGEVSNSGNQAWNAGMYILAYESLKRGKVLI